MPRKKGPAKWSNKLTCNWAQLINVQHTHRDTHTRDLWRKHNGQLPALVPRPLGCRVNCSACKCHNGAEGQRTGDSLCHAGRSPESTSFCCGQVSVVVHAHDVAKRLVAILLSYVLAVRSTQHFRPCHFILINIR